MKKSMKFVAILALALAWSTAAYAEGNDNCPIKGACQSIGGFLYNALPWNWGNWMGK